LQFKKLPCKSLEEICNVAKSQLNFPQFLLEVPNFLLQVPVLFWALQLANKNNRPITTLRTESQEIKTGS
jgi:large-conductance mechanosensitive channel